VAVILCAAVDAEVADLDPGSSSLGGNTAEIRAQRQQFVHSEAW